MSIERRKIKFGQFRRSGMELTHCLRRKLPRKNHFTLARNCLSPNLG